MNYFFEKFTITSEFSDYLIIKAKEKAIEIGVSITITIVDIGGNIKALQRMDNAPLMSVDASLKKAKTAIGFGLSTGNQWFNFIENDPILREGIHSIQDFILLGGGKPIYINNTIIGAIGISGGHYTQDELCVNWALKDISE